MLQFFFFQISYLNRHIEIIFKSQLVIVIIMDNDGELIRVKI